jgi:hypothetical protein
LTETVVDEKTITQSEPASLTEKIAERKIVVYETRVDSTVIKVMGEKLKTQLFAKFGFMKPKPEEIRLVSIDKFYEPYMVISGRYFIDYYRKCIHTIKVDKKVLEVILLDHRFKPSEPSDPRMKDHKVVGLKGEERLVNDIRESLILDKSGQEVPPNRLASAPSERSPMRILKEYGALDISPEADVSILQSKIVRRPKDADRLVRELFEVTERAVIYSPRFRVAYKNIRSDEERAVEFDGVTSERIQLGRPFTRFLEKLA